VLSAPLRSRRRASDPAHRIDALTSAVIARVGGDCRRRPAN
jgi:hypothetical protein